MIYNSDEDATLYLAVSAFPSLSRDCRAEAPSGSIAGGNQCTRPQDVWAGRRSLNSELDKPSVPSGGPSDPNGMDVAIPLTSRGGRVGFTSSVVAPEEPRHHSRALLSAYGA